MLRDESWIDGTLAEIGNVWRDHPHLRLSQLLMNVVPSLDPTQRADFFYRLEDYDLIERVQELYNDLPPYPKE